MAVIGLREAAILLRIAISYVASETASREGRGRTYSRFQTSAPI